MAVNWKRGFRRIALICSVSAAIAGGVAGFEIAENSYFLQSARQELKSAEKEHVSDSSLLEEWNKTRQEAPEWDNPLGHQNSLWRYWTGEDFNEPKKQRLIVMSEGQGITLKGQGWHTVDGKVLPYHPRWVEDIIHRRKVAMAQYYLRRRQLLSISRAVSIGGALGFGSVWLLYLILEQVVSWFARGFHGVITQQKSGGINKRETKHYEFRRVTIVWGIVVAVICASWSIVSILAERYAELADFEIIEYSYREHSGLDALSTWSVVGLCALVGILTGACGFLLVFYVSKLVRRIYNG